MCMAFVYCYKSLSPLTRGGCCRICVVCTQLKNERYMLGEEKLTNPGMGIVEKTSRTTRMGKRSAREIF